MRWLLIVLPALIVGRANAADLTCDWRSGHQPFSVERVEAGTLRGARIVAVDPKWELIPMHFSAACETCTGDQIRLAKIIFSGRDPITRDVDKETSPESFAAWMARVQEARGVAQQQPPADVRAASDAVPVTMAGLAGKARKIRIRSPDGLSYEAVIIFVSQGCFALSAYAWAGDGHEVSLDRIGEFASAFDIQRYGPMPDPCPPDPRPLEDIPLLERLKERPRC
jgi:hypothetical protein